MRRYEEQKEKLPFIVFWVFCVFLFFFCSYYIILIFKAHSIGNVGIMYHFGVFGVCVWGLFPE